MPETFSGSRQVAPLTVPSELSLLAGASSSATVAEEPQGQESAANLGCDVDALDQHRLTHANGSNAKVPPTAYARNPSHAHYTLSP